MVWWVRTEFHPKNIIPLNYRPSVVWQRAAGQQTAMLIDHLFGAQMKQIRLQNVYYFFLPFLTTLHEGLNLDK